MLKRSFAFHALFGSAALVGACFDVQQVEVPDEQSPAQGLLVDDFEDGDWQPSSPLFTHWFCQGSTLACGVSTPGSDSRYAYAMNFELQDPDNGAPDYPSELLRTWRTGARFNFTHYESLVFSANLVPDAAAEEPATFSVDVLLSCPGQGDHSDAISSIASGIQPFSGWQTYQLHLADFRWRQTWQGPKVDASTCLAQIDGLGFYLGEPALPDGQTSAGTLMIDDVYLQ